MMDVRILELVEGAKKARGLTVIIDVFRAFSLECYLFDQGAARIYPIGSIEEARRLKSEHPGWLSFGERGGAQIEGFDFGNSPAQVQGIDLSGRTCIHTTSAGTQGIVNASHASEILTASLVNASAVARYIAARQPNEVSIVAMGTAGTESAGEDVLCARYIKALLEGTPCGPGTDFDVQAQADALRTTAGAKFFDPAQPQYPEADFAPCTACDRFDFVIRVGHDEQGRLCNTRFDVA